MISIPIEMFLIPTGVMCIPAGTISIPVGMINNQIQAGDTIFLHRSEFLTCKNKFLPNREFMPALYLMFGLSLSGKWSQII